jgi:hypothetical protein
MMSAQRLLQIASQLVLVQVLLLQLTAQLALYMTQVPADGALLVMLPVAQAQALPASAPSLRVRQTLTVQPLLVAFYN